MCRKIIISSILGINFMVLDGNDVNDLKISYFVARVAIYRYERGPIKYWLRPCTSYRTICGEPKSDESTRPSWSPCQRSVYAYHLVPGQEK